MRRVGRIREIYRYPIKSMAGESLPSVRLGWHGVEGDRRAAFVRTGVRNGFPWLTASKLPALLTYKPLRDANAPPNVLPSRVRTPTGDELDLGSDALRAELAAAHGAPVELMELANGIFDDAPVSIISTTTIGAIEEAVGLSLEVLRFRPNFLVETNDLMAMPEEGWVGKTVRMGEGEDAPVVAICTRDVRCVMINLDPWTAASDARVLKAAVRINSNCAGVYGTVIKTGTVAVGDGVYLHDSES